MKSIGLDIGTTTICGIVLDAKTGAVLKSETRKNDSTIAESGKSFEKLQNVLQILDSCNQMVESFVESYDDIDTIGVTGQMHGILYIDKEANAVTPLYSWQDGRGNCFYKNEMTYSQYMTKITGYKMATGYGMTTHFYNQENNCIPSTAVCFCTIPDFIAMKLAQKKRPIMHKSMAASMGLFELENGNFDVEAAKKLNMNIAYFPAIEERELPLGTHERGMKVSMALGDNQASFLGSVNEKSNILLNIGTGSQISIFSKTYDKDIKIEYRPYIENTFLMVGAPLCGGASYALLKDFYKKVLELFGHCEPDDIYDIMNHSAKEVYNAENKVVIDTRFNGTRENPKLRGSIHQLGMDNFAPEMVTLGMLQGICEELYVIYSKVAKENRQTIFITGSGNGIRKNALLRKVAEDTFEKKLIIPVFGEEASCGAALYSLYGGGFLKTREDIQRMIQTKKETTDD